MRRQLIFLVGAFSIGVLIGGFLFSKSIPRSFLAIRSCESSCYRPNDLAGLLVSAGIQNSPAFIPNVIFETDQCVVIKHPKPEARVHLVLFPKYDIKDIGSLTPESQSAVMGCFATLPQLISQNDAKNYRLLTNGPALQHVTYLHFHFMAK
jgi:hypothetical protein